MVVYFAIVLISLILIGLLSLLTDLSSPPYLMKTLLICSFIPYLNGVISIVMVIVFLMITVDKNV